MQPPEKFCKKTVLKNFLKFIFNSEYCEILQSPYFEKHLRTASFGNVHETEKKKKIIDKKF